MTDLPADLEDLLQAGYRYAWSLARADGDAEDLVQDACLGIVRAGAPWDRRYLFRCIRNRFLDLRKRAQLAVMEPFDETRAETEDLLAGFDDLLATRDALERGLAELRDAEREVLFLAVNERMTAREIGELTDRPRNTVLSLIHRARRKLGKVLDADAPKENLP